MAAGRNGATSGRRPGEADACRAAFLEGWRTTVDPSPSAERRRTKSLLALCELEKLLYELRYELAHRPDWVRLPLAGLSRILEPE